MKINLFSRTLIFITAAAGVLWTGSYALRLFLTYGLFEQTGNKFKPFINDVNISAIMKVVGISVTTTFILYLIFILMFFLTLLIISPSLKQNGWLFMILVIILSTLPFELYLMTFDFNLIIEIMKPEFNSDYVTHVFNQRFSTFGGFSFGMVLCYLTIVYLAIFKPFSKQL